MPRSRLLIVAPQLPQPDIASGERRFFAILEILAENADVDFVALDRWPRVDERYARSLASLGIRFLGYDRRRAQLALLQRSYDVVFFEFHHAALSLIRFVRSVQPGCSVVVDSVDVHFAREEAGIPFGEGDVREVDRTRAEELAVYGEADLVLTASREDTLILRDHGIPHTSCVPNVVPVAPRAQGIRAPGLLFVGAFPHRPNVHGIRWFLAESWAQVRGEVPDATLTIVGREPPSDLVAHSGREGVEVRGHVPDMRPLLDAAQVSIAPLLYGGGMKGKVSEALAHGLPLVTTTAGAQGFDETDHDAFLLADDATGFARQVVRLLGDPALRARLGVAGHRVAARRCSREAAVEGLEAVHALERARERSSARSVRRVVRALRSRLQGPATPA